MSGDDDEWAVDADGVDDSADQTSDEWDIDTDSVGDTEEDDDSEWRFSLEDLEDDGEESGAADGEDDVGGNVFGTLQSATEELEPGSPSLENTVFVVLGIVLALLLFAQFLLVILSGP